MEVESSNVLLDKTSYLGFMSRFKFRLDDSLKGLNSCDSLRILIISGKGGTKLTSEMITKVCLQAEDHQFTVIGNQENLNIKNATQIPFCGDIEPLITSHHIVISSCGLNLTSEVLAIKNKFIAFAEKRPYNEQEIILEGLIKNNLAVPLDWENFSKTLVTFFDLISSKNLHSMFGAMEDFNQIELFRKYLV